MTGSTGHQRFRERPDRDRAIRWAGDAVPSMVLSLVLSLVSVAAVQGQAPGYQQLDPGSVRAEYTAEVLDRINEHLAEWGDAWANDRTEELTELYWEDAILIPPGGVPLRGISAIGEYFSESLPLHGHIEAFMLDFDASGGMSQVFGNYTLGHQAGELAGTQESGPMITVYVRRGRTWRIRSQIFLLPG